MKKPSPSLLLIDNFDSFTYNLWDYFLRLGASCRVVRNDQLQASGLDPQEFDGIVLSPGPSRPEDAGGLMPFIRSHYQTLPMLGICLGHQAIGSFFEVPLEKAKVPMHGKTSSICHSEHPLFSGLPERFSVMRYHSLILRDFPEAPIEVIAWTDEGEIMAFSHKTLPLTGIQFHPESIQTEYGLEMLSNWIEYTFQTVPRL